MNIRYYCEHIAFRDLFSKDPIKIINKLLTEKEEYLFDLFVKIYDSKHEPFPYYKREFEITVSTKEQLEVIIITLPEAFIEPTLCHKIVLAYSIPLGLYQYFTVEDGFDPLFGKYKVLCSWIENNHIVFKNLKDEELDNLEQYIYDIVMVN